MNDCLEDGWVIHNIWIVLYPSSNCSIWVPQIPKEDFIHFTLYLENIQPKKHGKTRLLQVPPAFRKPYIQQHCSACKRFSKISRLLFSALTALTRDRIYIAQLFSRDQFNECDVFLPQRKRIVCDMDFCNCRCGVSTCLNAFWGLGHTDICSTSLMCSGFHIQTYVKPFSSLRENFWIGHWKCWPRPKDLRTKVLYQNCS